MRDFSYLQRRHTRTHMPTLALIYGQSGSPIFLHYSSNVRAAEEPTYDDDIVSTRQNFLNNILRLPSWNLEEERPFSSAANISDIYELELLVWLGMT